MAQYQFRPMQRLSPVVKNLLIINVLVWLAQNMLGPSFNDLFSLHFYKSEDFRPWQPLTHMFMHDTYRLGHLALNMLALWMFGSLLENIWGSQRFLFFYVVCGLMAAVVHSGVMGLQFHQLEGLAVEEMSTGQQIKYMGIMNATTVGASGAIYGLMASYLLLFPNMEFMTFLVQIPIKAKYMIPMMIAMEFLLGTRNIAGDRVAHFAHLGGALMGLLIVYYWRKKNPRRFY
jgi:membrane associated rhomboid family serine protease